MMNEDDWNAESHAGEEEEDAHHVCPSRGRKKITHFSLPVFFPLPCKYLVHWW